MNRQIRALKSATVTATFLAAGAALWVGSAAAAPLPPTYPSNAAALFDEAMRGEAPALVGEPEAGLSPRLQRQVVAYATSAAPGSVVIETAQTHLYFILGDGRAIRYGIGVGRDGFSWSGAQSVTRKAEWPDWTPPQEMIARQPYLPRFMAGGQGNPLGARAIYLGSTVYRIHGTNMPQTIGHKVSSGCIRMLNEDVIDLYARIDVGTRIVVLDHRSTVAAAPAARTRLATPHAYDMRATAIY
jgi:lipoprotein-anchoring transpeptidase ErfK/SrfK